MKQKNEKLCTHASLLAVDEIGRIRSGAMPENKAVMLLYTSASLTFRVRSRRTSYFSVCTISGRWFGLRGGTYIVVQGKTGEFLSGELPCFSAITFCDSDGNISSF